MFFQNGSFCLFSRLPVGRRKKNIRKYTYSRKFVYFAVLKYIFRSRKGMVMKKLKLSFSNKPVTDGVAAVRSFTVRERILRLLFGEPHKIIVLIPGDKTGELIIDVDELHTN